MDDPIELVEYGSQPVVLAPSELQSLMAAAGNRLVFAPTGHTNGYTVTATSYVGTVVTPSVRVVVRPKISLANLFYLLESGDSVLPMSPEDFGYEETSELLPALASLFARQVEVATRRGLFHAYREHDERLVAMRGRIDLAAQIRSPGMVSPVACRFDEYTTDVAENRILKCALRRVSRLAGVPERTRVVVTGLLFAFDEVADVEISHEAVDRIVPNRLNRHYGPSLRLAELVLRWSSLIDRAGRRDASAFLVNMNEVFEEFIEARLRHSLRHDLQTVGQYETWLDLGHHVRIKPDLVFRQQGRPVYVADTKYKLSKAGLGRQADYYQLHAYCAALGLAEGMLIYCHDEGEQPSREVITLGTSKRLIAHRLTLSGSRADIDAAVDRLASEIRDRIAGS